MRVRLLGGAAGPPLVVLLCSAALLLGGLLPHETEAQQRDCALRVQPQSGAVGYRLRGQRCEGMYVGLQSAPTSVQVISLVKGGLHYGSDARMLYIHVPQLPGLSNPITLLGQSREANLNWALDGTLSPGSHLPWNLEEVILPVGLASNRIGIVAQTTPPRSTRGDPVYIPVDVSPRLQLNTARDSLELIVRVPGAAALRWSFGASDQLTPAERLNVDGYFRITVPPLQGAESPRETPLAIYWRPRYQDWIDTPVPVRIYRW